MIKILLGGSPCTKWSIAQKNNRETTPSGIGWELFLNYLIAKEKFKPDYFLYENNVSAAQPIKDQIKLDLGVHAGARYIEINSALVSAQNRKRFYVHNCGEVEQPKDRGILLKNIIDSGERIPTYGNNGKSRPLTAGYTHKSDGTGGLLTDCFPDNPNKQVFDYIAEPLRVGAMPRPNGELSGSQALRIYGIDGKSTTLNAGGGGAGGKTGLYAIPINPLNNGDKSRTLTASYGKCSQRDATVDCAGGRTMVVTNYAEAVEFDDSGKPTKALCGIDKKLHQVYEVEGGKILIKGKAYPIKLADGFYIIRKLTVSECRRLQTIPDWYAMPCSSAQNYKMLGNGWTVEVIKHILGHIPEIKTGEPIEVLSMYDGMSCGQIALKELGANVVKYYATEIDKYCIQTTQANFARTVQLGDAFKVRNDDFTLTEG